MLSKCKYNFAHAKTLSPEQLENLNEMHHGWLGSEVALALRPWDRVRFSVNCVERQGCHMLDHVVFLKVPGFLPHKIRPRTNIHINEQLRLAAVNYNDLLMTFLYYC